MTLIDKRKEYLEFCLKSKEGTKEEEMIKCIFEEIKMQDKKAIQELKDEIRKFGKYEVGTHSGFLLLKIDKVFGNDKEEVKEE